MEKNLVARPVDYDPETEKILVSKDIVFEENRAWRWDLQKQEIQSARSSPAVFNIRMNGENTEDDSISYSEGATSNSNEESMSASNVLRTGSGTLSPDAGYQTQLRIQVAAVTNRESSDCLEKYMTKLKKQN